ncbi:MAG TPA: response regulator [Steroidobacteraceae bacterium]|jgi:DNA-binding response OmpR family regulator
MRLLVVEDEVVVGLYLQEELQDAGFSVTVREDAESALGALREETDETFDAAIVDVALPGVSGLEFVRQCRQADPAFPIVLTSGLDEDLLKAQFASDARARILIKPYLGSALLACLQELGVVSNLRPGP